MEVVCVHLWKDAEERKNVQRHEDFWRCENLETVLYGKIML